MRICITISSREQKELKQVAEIMGISQAAVVRIATSEYIHSNFYLGKKPKRK